MFARTLTFEINVEKKEELVTTIKDQVLPILHKQIGFLEMLPFFQTKASVEKVFTISIWTTQNDAERYQREFYPQVLEILKPFVVAPVEVSYSNLETTLCDRFVDALAV